MDQNLVTIRHATEEDADLLAELGARTFAQTFATDNTPEDMAACIAASFNPARQKTELADPKSIFLLADVGGVAAGYAQLHSGQPAEGIEGPKPVELVRLYASREWLGRGVGRALMRASFDEATVRTRNNLAWRMGAERTCAGLLSQVELSSCRRACFSVGSDPQRDILMQRAL